LVNLVVESLLPIAKTKHQISRFTNYPITRFSEEVEMAYSNKVIDHYENPRNVGSLPKDDPNVGTGLVGAPECGDVMKLQVKVNPQTGVIDDAKFKTFGCGSAIASSSLATEWLKGKTVDEALAIKNTDIVTELSLPPVKIHCSVLAEDAIKAAISDYKKKQGVGATEEAEAHSLPSA
jgi:nitrogen fixation NifU-like protein